MRTFLLAAAFAVAGAPVAAQTPNAPPAAGPHVILTPGAMKWGPAPPVLPAGAQIAVLDGDPGQAGPFTIRFKFPDGYKIAPHWHSMDENITVVQGTFKAGMGETLTPTGLHDFPVGSFLKMPAKAPHFAAAKGVVIVQIHGTGPFDLTYVNPKDAPPKPSAP